MSFFYFESARGAKYREYGITKEWYSTSNCNLQLTALGELTQNLFTYKSIVKLLHHPLFQHFTWSSQRGQSGFLVTTIPSVPSSDTSKERVTSMPTSRRKNIQKSIQLFVGYFSEVEKILFRVLKESAWRDKRRKSSQVRQLLVTFRTMMPSPSQKLQND